MAVACSYKILWPKIDFLIFLPHFPLSTGHFFQHGGQARKMQKKSFFLQKWPVPMLVQNISRGHEILKTFWIFGAPYYASSQTGHLRRHMKTLKNITSVTMHPLG